MQERLPAVQSEPKLQRAQQESRSARDDMNQEPLPARPIDPVSVGIDRKILERKAVEKPECRRRGQQENNFGKPAMHLRSARIPGLLPA